MVLSPRVLFEFSVIESSSGSAVFFINALFSPCRYFLSNRATIFLIKNRCLVLHSSNSQKQLCGRVY